MGLFVLEVCQLRWFCSALTQNKIALLPSHPTLFLQHPLALDILFRAQCHFQGLGQDISQFNYKIISDYFTQKYRQSHIFPSSPTSHTAPLSNIGVYTVVPTLTPTRAAPLAVA